jgi:hypothetical protein
MSRIPRFLVDPDKPESIVQQMEEIHRVADGDIGFGHPNDPNSIGSTTAAGAADVNHNGTLENITGSWVEVTFPALDTAVTCHHNLFRNWPDYVLPITGEPNVRWLVFGFSHDGDTADAASTLSVNFEKLDTVAANSIQLRLYKAGARVVDGTHPVTATLFFIPAVKAPLETAP